MIDLRTIKPLDEAIILESLEKTGRLVVVDTAWMKGGVCAEIGCLAAEKGFRFLKAPVARVGLPDVPTPAGYTLEQFYYPDAARIAARVRDGALVSLMFYDLASTTWGEEELDGHSARLPVRAASRWANRCGASRKRSPQSSA